MNKRQILSSLNHIANSLEYSGLYSEANTITKIMIKISQPFLDDSEDGKYSAAYSNILEALENNDQQAAISAYQEGLQNLSPQYQQKLKNWWNYTNKSKYYQNSNNKQTPTKTRSVNQNNTQTQNLSRQQIAQQWINQNSPKVSNDIQKLYEMAKQGKNSSSNPIDIIKYNDVMAILQKHPKKV